MNFNNTLDYLKSEKFFFWFMAALIAFNLIHTSFLLPHPFTGQNEWRDAQTYGVARNFLEEPGSLIEPRYDIRIDSDGRLPGEFPLQSLYAACFMKLTSVSIFNARVSTFLLGLAGILLLYGTVKHMADTNTALLAVAMYTSNALAMSQMVSIMPETMVLFLFSASLFCYFTIKNKVLKWALVITGVILCTLVKPSGYVIICFFVFHHLVSNPFKLGHLFFYSLLCFLPLAFLKVWISYTIQFEEPSYGYPITHHYVRTFRHFLDDFGADIVTSSFEKTFRYAFNIIGLLGLIALIFRIFRVRFSKDEAGFTGGIALWLAGSIAFLFYAGDVQKVQLYYATPLIIPAILLVVSSIYTNKNILLAGMLLLLLQTNIKVNTFKVNYFETYLQWEDMRLEKVTDTFSTRKDLFIVYPYLFPNFTMLGRLGRRGLNLSVPEQVEACKKSFSFICLTDTAARASLKKFLLPEPLYARNGIEIYKLRP